MRQLTLVFSVVFCILLACKSNENDHNILGKWESVNWIIKDSKKTLGQTIVMIMKKDGEYEIDYGSEKELGKYWISYDKLYTKETGRSEKNVQIIRLDIDTMELEMNRSGQIETLILSKVKFQ